MTDDAVISIVGIRTTMKHFKGQGECCGGSSYKPRKAYLVFLLIHIFEFIK